MRILYVTQIVPYPPHGGVLQRGYNLLRELGSRHEVHLLAFHHRDELPPGEPVEQSRRELGRFCRSVEYFDLWPKRSVIHRLAGLAAAALHPAPFSVLAHRSGQLSRRLSAICHGAQAPDIVHLDTIALAPYANDCGDLPVVLAHHNIESQLMQRRAEFERGWLQRRYVGREAAKLRQFEAQVAGRFLSNITVSDADAGALGQICPGAVTDVIPNGVDTDYFTPRRGQETSTLVFTGGMNMFANRDGVDWFLESVWPAIKARVPDARFVAIGQRPSERLRQAVGRDSFVEAPGFVQDVRPAVARAAVYIVPLRVGGGTRLKVLDAMAQGKAIVSTALGAEGLDVHDGVHLVLADDARSFADRVVYLLQHPDERLRLGDAARKKAELKYSWAILGERLAGVYARAIEGARR
ncbi:MAG: glycosyltransferase [Steroidobacteraceae bacterium]